MKILSAKQIYSADKFTIEKQQISSDSLMERAALGIFNWLHERLQGNPIKIHLFCGIGNNGGDGLALARHLKEHDYQINAYVVNYSDKRSPDFLKNLDRLKDRKLWPEFLDEKNHTVAISPDDIIVDAIFGIGLNREPSVWVGTLIQKINRSRAFVLSVDIPSGLFMNSVPKYPERVVEANHILSFQYPKLPFFLPQTAKYANQWELLDIGLDQEYYEQIETAYHLTGKFEVLALYRPRLKFSHKGNYGHAVLVGGSYGKIGAVSMATKSCLTVGAGLVTAFIPKCGYQILQSTVPEAMVVTDENEHYISNILLPFEPTVIGIGVGMGTNKESMEALEMFLSAENVPLVIDADGLNLLAKNQDLLRKLPKNCILTPHSKELERLIGTWKDDFDKLEKAKFFSRQYKCILVMKGAYTHVISDGVGYINATGNPGMATAGSGDVLTGMITGLLSQGHEPLQAAILGVYLHGLAGDIASSKMGYEALTATKIIDDIGSAFLDLIRGDNQEVQSEGKG